MMERIVSGELSNLCTVFLSICVFIYRFGHEMNLLQQKKYLTPTPYKLVYTLSFMNLTMHEFQVIW